MLPDPLTPGCRSFTSTNRKAFLALPGGHSGGLCGLPFEEGTDSPQDGGIHPGRHAPRLGILLAWVVGAEQARRVPGHFGFRAMREFVQRARRNRAALFQNFEICIPGDFSQRQDDFRFQNFQFTLEVASTIQDFFGEWFVVGRRAAAGCADVSIL